MVRITVTGPIVIDQLMTYPGQFTHLLLPDQLAHLSLSFLVDDLGVHEGGVAADVAYGLAGLGHRPVLLGAAGRDFGTYRARLERAGVDTSGVRVSERSATARFTSTTDADRNRISSFHPGASGEEAGADPEGWADGSELVFLGPAGPGLMAARAGDCRRLGLPFVVDPAGRSAEVARYGAEAVLDGAGHLVTNRRERAQLLEHTGRSAEEVLRLVGCWVTTLGLDGVWIDYADRPSVAVPAVPAGPRAGGTSGAGGAFRAGFLAGLAEGLDDEAAARAGCLLAVCALESTGSQGYRRTAEEHRRLLAGAYPGPVEPDPGPPVRRRPARSAGR
ncbi:PfkB family carbohydrate kinase [Kitasatospora sp. NPDC002040]|uniref:PfkB family carbohydrate kinase n=1 Tax=Kitasatospora sp. NPDC002040 TaxID=3154661 RepID=UPI0033230452